MQQQYLLLILFFSISIFQVSAQRKTITPLTDSGYQNWSIGIGYITNVLINPGVMASAEKPFKTWHLTKVKRNGKERNRHKALIGSGHLGAYHHHHNHVGILTSAHLGYRIIRPKGLKLEYAVGLGYFHQIQDGQTYEVTNDNQVIEKGITGQGAIMPSITVGLGVDNWFNKKSRISWYWRASYLIQIPYNHAFILRTPLEVGINYKLVNSQPNKEQKN